MNALMTDGGKLVQNLITDLTDETLMPFVP